jgi:hypothetical protein
MAEIVSNNGEVEALPAANTNGIIGWLGKNAWNQNVRRMFPKA